MASSEGGDGANKRGKRLESPRFSADSEPPAPDAFRPWHDGQGFGQYLFFAGWTVAEQFIREGFYYQLLRRPSTAKPRPQLTRREHDVLRLACEGHSNKSVAQQLQVSASTVGVLLFRAAAKLNVASRNDLLRAYEEHLDASRGDEPTPELRGAHKK
jgi:DNA-binding CsgD family transcriptional regulator